MSKIKALVTADGAETQISQDQMPEVIQVGTVDTDNPVKKLAWSFNGRPKGLISGASFVKAFSKLGRAGLLGADVKVSQGFTLCDGEDKGKFEMTLTNSGVTTPDIYGWSRSQSGYDTPGVGGLHVIASMLQINANSYHGFDKFSAVLFDPANLENAIITFNRRYQDKTGKLGPVFKFSQKFLADELPGLFTAEPGNVADADGKLAGLTVIENFAGLTTPAFNISRVELYAGAAALDVLWVSLENE